ncbi:hypothetical protein PRIPAC_89654 [Pristionchus pacificus]|uniref:Protein AAR2 homolog n=1 Tax=Pristionchus pacificus TaxID=54126 RepID=A0A2A6D3D3_PRIPA|nr:hypothetical protein PRIPAC_89654 [Pristionchus pacificus]|eukprot:PDM84898.1 hypothetical protein PRIPAC_33921 [Pristionchus pacificus]
MDAKLLACLRSGAEIPPPLVPIVYEYGAFLILRDFPVGSEFGIDYKSWKTGDQFMGLKMIPPGVHFVYVSVKGMPRIGFFHNFQPKEVLVKKWSKETEDLDESIVSAEEIERFRSNLKNMDRMLGPYPYEEYRKWYSLTDFITQSDVDRLNPEKGRISAQAELESLETKMERESDVGCSSKVTRENPKRMRFADEEGLPVMEVKPGFEIQFTLIPQLPGDRGRRADHSVYLQHILSNLSVNEVLAELQYAFVCFLIGQVFEGLEQWKKMIHLVCLSPSSIGSHNELFVSLMRVLFYQTKECPKDFFIDILSKDNFLTTTLSVMFANIADSRANDELKKKSANFKLLLERNFKWSFECK